MSSFSGSYLYRSPVRPIEDSSSLNYSPHHSNATFWRHSYTFDTFRHSSAHPLQQSAFHRHNYTSSYQTPFVCRFEPAYRPHKYKHNTKLNDEYKYKYNTKLNDGVKQYHQHFKQHNPYIVHFDQHRFNHNQAWKDGFKMGFEF
ncbi:hypothetical protein niasHS_013749 [Heterodera schachtii]|uniref:Uncharacterized protein n=1 Tax=Heterodera schachtii TaxID=97005 RepID=A0ABD2IRU6_HETSC